MATCGAYECGEWKTSNQGFTAKGEKGGKMFFLKKYNNYTQPVLSESTSKSLFKKMKDAFDKFMDYRIEINKTLASVAGPGGNIIYPTDWFVQDKYYTEATEFVPNLIETDDILKLSINEKLDIMKTAAATLDTIHRKKIVHSDLKIGNIVAIKNPNKDATIKYLAKLIDFDKSYFEDHLPCVDDLGGSQFYLSPELTYCMICDFEESSLTALSTKSDIFSLGIVFYNYLVNGEYPPYSDLPPFLMKKKAVYPGEALVNKGKIVLKKENLKEDYLVCLIANMLHPEPEKRPSAGEVLKALRSMEPMTIVPSDLIVTEGIEIIPKGFCEPWPEHDVEFDEEALRAAGFVSMERYEPGKIYTLYKKDKTFRRYSIAIIRSYKWLSKDAGIIDKASPSDTSPKKNSEIIPGLWEEHADYTVDDANLAKFKYAKLLGHVDINATHMYMLETVDGSKRPMSFQILAALGILKKK